MNMKKKRVIITIIGGLVGFAVIYLAEHYSDYMFMESVRHTRGMEFSPDKKYTATLMTIADTDFSSFVESGFAEDNVKVIVKEEKTNKQLAVIETSTQCDISRNKDENSYGVYYNWDVVWQNDSVKIILKDNAKQDKICIVPLQ